MSFSSASPTVKTPEVHLDSMISFLFDPAGPGLMSRAEAWGGLAFILGSLFLVIWYKWDRD